MVFGALADMSIMTGSGHRTCGFFSSTACFADFLPHAHANKKFVKRDCDPNGNNCKEVRRTAASVGGAHPNAEHLIEESYAGH